MNFITIIFIGALVTMNLILQAQSIERATFDLAGGVASTDQFIVHYSLGQPFTRTIDLGDLSVSEGFIQGSINEILTAVILYPKLDVGISPNPSFDRIQISSSEHLPNSTIRLFDAGGHLVLQRAFQQQMQVQISHLVPGTYFLNWVDDKQQLVRQFKVVKL